MVTNSRSVTVQRMGRDTRSSDIEESVIANVGLFFFHVANLAETGSPAELAREFIKRRGGANRINFHASVRQILRVSGQAERLGGMLGEVAVADALHTAGDIPAPGGLGRRWHNERQN